MNPNYVDTITIWNCLKGADNPQGTGDVWYKRVMTGCFFKVVTQQVNSGINSQMSGAYVCRIPASTEYLPYTEWAKESASTRGSFFTARNDDIVILGSSSDTITSTAPNTSAQILVKNKPNAFKVTAVSDNSKGFDPHYRLGG